MTRKQRPRYHKHRKPAVRCTYSALDLLLASSQPMGLLQRQNYIDGFNQALNQIQFAAVATPEHWRIMADAVNLCETFCRHPWPDPEGGAAIDIEDSSDAISQATSAMRQAAATHKQHGGNIRISATGREALASLVEFLDTILQTVSHRSALQCHNQTEIAIRAQRRAGGSVISL